MKPTIKNLQKNREAGKEATVSKKQLQTSTALLEQGSWRARTLFIAGAVALLTFLLFTPSLHNEFLKTWDDQAYVTDNNLIKDLSFKGIKRMFKEDAGLYANYHPLTILSLALNYHDGVTSFPYHLTSLILHTLNTLLVFLFIYLLSGKKVFVAGLTSLWFGIHPMHVESVAWISERKDVLYTFFYLLSLISYWHYVVKVKENQKSTFSVSPLLPFSLSLIFFFLSSLSKAMAVSLPVVLLLMDYFLKRKFTMKIILEKIPFVLISIVLGLYAMKVQTAGGATQGIITFPFFNKVLHASYGFTMYIVKLFAPVGLSAFYPYPYTLSNSAWIVTSIPGILYITFWACIAIIIVTIIIALKKPALSNSKSITPEALQTNLKRSFIFGVGFYFSTIALVLQFFPVGRTIMSDRYAYIPYIGLFFLIAETIYYFLNSSKSSSVMVDKLFVAVALIYSFVFAFITFNQIKVWKNDETLWSATINNYKDNKDKVVLAYANRAAWYFAEKKYDAALNDYLIISQYDKKDVYVLEKIGRIYGQEKNDLDNAIIYFQKAYETDAKSLDALKGLSTAYGLKGQYAKALEFSLKALEKAPDDATLYNNASMSYYLLGDQQKAAEYKAKAEKLAKK